MADKAGQADIRGLDIDKLARGFADRQYIFRNFVNVTPTSSREIRWSQKTSGTLTSQDSSGLTADTGINVSGLGKPTQINPSVTRNTSYIKTYTYDSDWISDQDLKDTDIDILAHTIRDVTLAVTAQVDTRIWNVLTENLSPSNINTSAAVGTGWDDTTNGNPIIDLLSGVTVISSFNYDVTDMVAMMNQVEYKNLINYLITVKGSSVPQLASQLAQNGVLTNLMNHRIVVSPNATTDYVLQAAKVPGGSWGATWKQFSAIQSRVIEEPLIGSKFRVREEGECILHDPKAYHLITDTVT